MSNKKTVNTYSDELITLVNQGFSRTGYSIEKWTLNKDGTGISYALNSTARFDTDTTLYAKWKKDVYTINWVSNGGSPVENWTREYGSLYSNLPVPSKTDYEFIGWFNESGTQQLVEGTSITGNATYYAQWKELYPSITVKFNANGGKVNNSDIFTTSGKINKTLNESGVVIPDQVEHSDNTFYGWYTGINDGIQINRDFMINEDMPEIYMSGGLPEIMFYAHWTQQYTFQERYLNGYDVNDELIQRTLVESIPGGQWKIVFNLNCSLRHIGSHKEHIIDMSFSVHDNESVTRSTRIQLPEPESTTGAGGTVGKWGTLRKVGEGTFKLTGAYDGGGMAFKIPDTIIDLPYANNKIRVEVSASCKEYAGYCSSGFLVPA